MLLCPVALGALACVVEDALRARGYQVRLEMGRRARRWVRHVPPGPPTVRVLCVSTIDPAYAQRLCQGRPDFHIVGLTTPRAVVDEVEQIVGQHRPDRVMRPSRMFLVQPTLMEQSLHTGRRLRRSAAMTLSAAALVVVGGLFGALVRDLESSTVARSVEPAAASVQVEDTAASRPTMRSSRVDDRVFSSVAPTRR